MADDTATVESTEQTSTETPGDAEIVAKADNPDAVKAALDREREAAKSAKNETAAAKREAEQLRAKVAEFEDQNKSETEKLTGKVETLTGENKSLSAENLRLRVALEKKLPAELIDRLKGDSKEEIEADADELMQLVKPQDATDFGGGVRETATTKSPEEAHNDLLLKLAGRDT